jgi:hypothetical protein
MFVIHREILKVEVRVFTRMRLGYVVAPPPPTQKLFLYAEEVINGD